MEEKAHGNSAVGQARRAARAGRGRVDVRGPRGPLDGASGIAAVCLAAGASRPATEGSSGFCRAHPGEGGHDLGPRVLQGGHRSTHLEHAGYEPNARSRARGGGLDRCLRRCPRPHARAEPDPGCLLHESGSACGA